MSSNPGRHNLRHFLRACATKWAAEPGWKRLLIDRTDLTSSGGVAKLSRRA
jgi:hypothetical protein